MGCGASTPVTAVPAARDTANPGGELSDFQHCIAHQRLQKLRHLDEHTKVPFILIELRGHGDRDGYIEICGKDEYGVYKALEQFLVGSWNCAKLETGDLSEATPVPFCDALFRWTGFLTSGEVGLSNMGLSTMELVHFMTNKLGWTLGVINGGNVGKMGEIREQQIIFKAPHPMNMVVPHVMVELRSAGYIEVCGQDAGMLHELETHFVSELGAVMVEGYEKFCTRCYKCPSGTFKGYDIVGDNNMGLLTTRVCDAVVQVPGWSLVTMNGGNYGERGTHREQQLVFRWDNHPLRNQPHLLVELRGAGFVEINGQDIDGIYQKLYSFLMGTWGCSQVQSAPGLGHLSDRKFRWEPQDMMQASAEITGFFHHHGWQMQVCSQGTVDLFGKSDSREQQILFRPGSSGLGILEPHLFIELYTGEGHEDLCSNAEKTQVPANQHIRVRPVGDCSAALHELHSFVTQYLGGSPGSPGWLGDHKYDCDIFLSRGRSDSNLGFWTMRICDFMVDRLGWSFVVCNVCNLGTFGERREQQLVFRYDGERREIPLNKDNNVVVQKERFAGVPLPSYWTIPAVLSFRRPQGIVTCDVVEVQALQEMIDQSFQRILTRDRVYEAQLQTREEMPYRLEVVHAFRSENLELYHNFHQRCAAYKGGTPFEPKTLGVGGMLNSHLGDGEAFLFHGTNPSSAMGILKTGFALQNAGKSTGTMFGNGLYLAESSSKSDEYARDDGGGAYPELNALLVCRSLVGNPHVVCEAGDHVAAARQLGLDCVVGDRESKAGTYREFVFFDEHQVLPEYTVIYRREYDQRKVPAFMRKRTFGTTGRCWQVKSEKGWVNIPADANQWLLHAQADAKPVQLAIGDCTYIYDLAARTQTNIRTGTVSKLRPPMVKSTPSRSLSTISTASTMSSAGSVHSSPSRARSSYSSTSTRSSTSSMSSASSFRMSISSADYL